MNRRVILEMDAEEVLAVLSAMEYCEPHSDLTDQERLNYESAYGQMVEKTKHFMPLSVRSRLKVIPGNNAES